MRRFIAGAVCPQCQAVDKIVVSEENGQLFRQCVRCGFRDARPEDNAPVDEVHAPHADVVRLTGVHHRGAATAHDDHADHHPDHHANDEENPDDGH